MMAFE